MKVLLQPQGKEFHFAKRMQVKTILRELQLNAESVLVIRDNRLLISEDWVEKDGEVVIRGVISGG